MDDFQKLLEMNKLPEEEQLKRLSDVCNKFKISRERIDSSNVVCDLALEQFDRLIGKWRGPLPKLTKYFSHDDMNWFLSSHARNKQLGQRLVDFAVSSGYRAEQPEREPPRNGDTALHRVQFDHLHSQERLVRQLFKIYDRFDLEYVNGDYERTHFHVACQHGLDDVVENFLELGQDPDCLEQVNVGGEMPLELAIVHERRRIMELLLRANADPNLRSNYVGYAPLHFICSIMLESVGVEFMRLFFRVIDEKGREVSIDPLNDYGQTPLQMALINGRKELAAILLDRGADPTMVDECERTTLHVACKDGDRELAEMLLKRGVDANSADNDGRTALHSMCDGDRDDGEFVDWFIGTNNDEYHRRVEIDARDKLDRTPLDLARAKGHRKIVEVLLRTIIH